MSPFHLATVHMEMTWKDTSNEVVVGVVADVDFVGFADAAVVLGSATSAQHQVQRESNTPSTNVDVEIAYSEKVM
jgi:hypothetical protein